MEKSRGNFSSFIEEYNKIQNILYGTENEVKVEVHTFKKYLTDNKENIELMKELLTSEGKQSLAIGKAGKGKTFLANTCFQELAKKATDNDIYVILLPNTAQTKQLNKEYNMISVVGKTPDLITYNFKENKIFGIVYDKATDIDEIYNRFPNLRVHALVDETHNTVSQSGFREEAIENLEYFKNQILAHKGSVVLLTATPQVIQYEKVDRIIDFEEEGEYTAPTDEFNIFINSNKQNFDEFVVESVKKIGRKQIIRYNSTTGIEKVSYSLKSNGYKVFSSYRGLGKDNEILKDLVETSQLPEHDFILTTSLIDCGINIKEQKEAESLTFVVPNSSNVDMMNFEQFFNRYRGKARSYNIIIENGINPEAKTGEFSEFIKEEYKKVSKQVTYLDMILNCLKFKYNDNTEGIKEEFNYNLSFEDINGNKNSLDCIYLKDLNVEINMKRMFFNAFKEYNRQFFYNIEALKNKLVELFNIKINIFEENEEININLNEQFEEYARKELTTKSIKDIEKAVKKSETFKKIKEFIDLGCSEEDSKKYVLETEEKEMNETLKAASKDYLERLPEVEVDAMNTIFSKYGEEEVLMSDTFTTVLNSYYGNEIRKALNNGYDVKETIEVIVNSKKDINIKNYFNLKQYIYLNNAFLSDRKLLNSKAGKEQEIIISYFFYNNGTSRNKALNSKNLKEVADMLNKKFSDKYTEKKVLKVACLAFNISDKTNSPTSLRKEYKSEYLF